MAMRTLLIAVLSASVVLARVVPMLSRDSSADLVRNTRKLSDLPAMNMSTVHDSGPEFGPININSTQHPSHQEGWNTTTLEKRTQISGATTIGVRQCIYPAPGRAPLSDDCSRVCAAIVGYTSPVIVGPLDIEEWNVGLCTFRIANLQPCDTLEIDPLSLFGPACESLLNYCVANGKDGVFFGGPPAFGISLYGQPAAPPYQEAAC